MKRYLALILSALFIAMCFCGCAKDDVGIDDDKYIEPDEIIEETVVEQPENSLYKPYIKAIVDKNKKNKDAKSYGVLYDVDSDDTDELIVLYYSDKVKDPSTKITGPSVAYGIYTVVFGGVVPLEEDHFLFPMAGGPSGCVYILENPEETYLAFRYCEKNPGEEDSLVCLGNWYIYTLDGIELELAKNCEYQYVYTMEEDEEIIDYANSTVTINGEKGSYQEFEVWLDTFETTEILAYSDEYEESSLKNLLGSLE